MSIFTTDVSELLAELDHERLRSIGLIPRLVNGWSFVLATTKRELDIVIDRPIPGDPLPGLVAEANRSCIGKRIVHLSVDSSPHFELVLENGFSIRTIQEK